MTLDSKQTTASEELQYASGGLKRETDWRGAFVMGLAGTILVTGIGPVMVTALGAASTPINIFITLTAWLNILFIAELAAMMPERTGGSPSYAYPAYSARWPRMAKHINGFTAWAYWLGWFPVAPLNMILASFYLADRFGINTTAGFTPVHTFIAWSTVIISMIGILLFFIPAYRGIRFGTGFATVLAVLSMIPLTFIAVAWMFNPSVVNLGELTGFRHVDGSSFFSPIGGFNWLQVYIAYGFLLSWNVVGIESAACYIGECANPDRDAKIALNLEGAYATFIFTLIPIAFIVVLGAKALSDPTLADPKTIFVTFAGKVFPGVGGQLMNWVIALMLIVALSLSALNAIMGCGRSLYQMALDGEFPLWFTKLNRHGVPANAMAFNVVCSLIVVMAGGAVEIYSFSNVGYVVSFIPVLIGYYLLRQDKPDLRRPFKLPEFMKYVALALAAVFFVFWLFGGIWYSKLGNVEFWYWAGWVTLALYLPLYWYRVYVEDKRSPA
ncbi:MAG: APC family permease [Methyloceanibacter sp.]